MNGNKQKAKYSEFGRDGRETGRKERRKDRGNERTCGAPGKPIARRRREERGTEEQRLSSEMLRRKRTKESGS